MSSCKEGKPERDGNSADGDIGGSQSDITAHLPKETKETMGASQTHFSKRSQSRSAQGRKGQQTATTESINIAAATGGISDTAPSTARNVDASETSEFTTNAKPVERIETVTGEIETTTAKIAPTATVDVVADTATVNAFRDTATKVNTDTTESIVDDATAEVIAATATVEVMTDTVTSINGFATDEETSGAITAEEISDSAVAEEISDSATAEEISDSAKAEVISDSATAEEISESATAEEISDSAVAEEIYDSATAEEISDSAKTEEISDSATAEEISDFDTAEETSDFDTAEEISDSATTEVIAEADSATAEITDSAKCEKINGISTTNVTTEPAQTDRASEVASGKGRITTSVVTQGTTGTVAYYSSCDDRGLTEATGTRQVEGTTDVKLSKATTDTVIANSKLNAKARDFRPIEAKNTIKTETKMTEETYIASVESNPEIVSDRSRKDIGSLKTEREILLGDTGPDVAPISSKSVIGPTCSNSETVPIERITESAEPTGSNAEIGTGTKKNLAASTIDPALVNSIKEFVPLSRRAETIHASSNAEAESVFNNPYTVTVNRLASSWQTNLDRTESSEETNYTQLVYQNGNFPLYAPNIANAQFFDQNIARGAVFDQGTGNVASYAGNHALLEGNTVLLYSENAGRTNGLPAAWSFHGISNTVQTRHIPNVVPSQGMSTIFPVYDMFNNAQVTAGTQNVTAHPIQTGIVTHQMANTVPGHMVINNVPTPNMSNTALTHYTPSAFPNYGVINSVQTPRMPIVLPHHGMLNTASAHNATVSIENANGAPVRKSSFNNVSVAEVANCESPESKGAANKRPRSNYGRNSRSSSTLNRSRRASDIPPATTTNGTESTLVSTGSVSISASDSANTTDTPSKDTTLISVPTDTPFSSPAANTESNIPSNATNVMLTETTPGTSSSAATSTRSAVVNTLPTVSNISTAGAIIVPKKATHAVPTASASPVAVEVTQIAPTTSAINGSANATNDNIPTKANTSNAHTNIETESVPINTVTSKVQTRVKSNKKSTKAKASNVRNKAQTSDVAAETGTSNAPIQSKTSDVTTGAKTKVPNKAKTSNLAAEIGTDNAPIQSEISDVTTGAKTKVPIKAKTSNLAAETGTSNAPIQTETSDVTTGAKTKVPNKAKISNVAAEIGTPIQTGTSNAQIKTARELISDSETVSAEGATAAPSTSKSTKKLPENTSSKSRAQNRKLGRNKGNERQRRSTAQRSTEVLQENVQIFKKRLSTRMQESEMKIDKVQSDVSTLEKNVANWKRDLNNTFGNESSQKVIRPVEMYVDKLRHSVSFSTDTSQAASDESCWEELAKAKTLTHELLIQIEHIIKQLKHLPLRDIALGDIRFESLSEESISKDGVNYFDGCDPIDSVASSSRDNRFTKREPRSNNTQDQTEKSKDQTDSILPSFVRSTDKVSKNRVKGRRIKKRFPEPNPNSGLGALPDPAIHVTVHPGQEGQRVNINFRKNFPQSHPPTHTLEPPTGLERLFPRTRSTRSNQPERNERHYSFSTPPTAAATESRMPNENPVIEQSNLSVSSEPVLSPRSNSFGNRQKSPQEMFDNAAPQMSHFNSALLRSGRAQMEPAKSNLLNFNMGAQTYVNDIVVEVLKALLNPWFDLLNKLSGQLQPGAHPSTVQYNQHWHSRNRRRGYNARKINRMETERGDLTVNLTNKIENVQRQLSYPDSCASNSEISLPQPVTDTDEIPISASPSEDLADLNRQRHASRSDTSVINGENSQVMSDNESHDNLDLNEQSTSQCTEQNLESHPQKLVLKIAQLQSDPTTVSESAEVLTIELDDTKLSSEALGSDVKEVGNSGMQSNTSAEPNENNEQEVQNSPVHEGSGETNMPNEPRFNESRFSQERHGLNGHELGFIPRQQQHQRYRYNMSGYDSDRGIIQPDTHTGRHMSDINPFVRQGVDGSFTMDAKRIMQQFSGASLDIQFYRETGIWRFRYGQDIGRDDCNICPDNATYYSQTGSNRNRYNSNTYFTGRETFRRQRRFAWPPKNPFLNPDNNLASVGIGNPAFYQLKPRVSQMAIVFPQMTSDKYLSGMNSLVFLEREGLLVALDLKNSFVKNFLIYESQKGKPKVVSAGSLNFTSCQPLFMSKLDSSSVIVARMQSRLTVVKCGRSLNQPEWVHDFKCMRQYSGMTYLKENVVVCSCFSQRRIDVVRIRGVEIETITRVEDLEYRPEVLCYMPTTKLLVFLEKSETDGSFLVGVTKGGDVKFNVPFDPKPENSWNITQCCDTIVACCKNTNQFRLIGSDGKNLADIDFPPHALDRPFGLVFDTKGRLYVANEGVPNNGIPPFTKPNIRVFQFSHCN